MLEAAGRHSFGPILLLLGSIVFSPLGGIPGLPTTAAAIVILVVAQLVMQRESFWLPRWISRRRISRDRMLKALRLLRPLVRIGDRILRPRWRVLTDGIALYWVAAFCALIALTMPPLEVIPFANSAAGAVVVVMGLPLTVRDGLLVAVALGFFAAAAAALHGVCMNGRLTWRPVSGLVRCEVAEARILWSHRPQSVPSLEKPPQNRNSA